MNHHLTPGLRLLFVSGRGDAFGGASLHVRDMARRLSDDGHTVRIVVGGTEDMVVPQRFAEKGLDFICLPEMGRSIHPVKDAKALLALRREIRRFAPDLVSAHASKGGALARPACMGLNIPVLYTPHCWSFVEGFPKARLYRQIEALLARQTTRLIAVCEDERRFGLEQGVGREEQTLCIHNGVEEKELIPPPAPAGDDDPETTRIVMVGRFEEQKDHPLLIRALADLQDHKWHLNLVGDGPLMERSEALTSELGLGNRVTFAGYSSQVASHLAEADLFVLATNWEGFPRSILEAMRAGLPTVVSDVGGCREAVIEGRTGHVVAKGSLEELREALRNILTHKDLQRSMGDAARTLYLERFTFEHMYRKYLTLYQSITKQPTPALTETITS